MRGGLLTGKGIFAYRTQLLIMTMALGGLVATGSVEVASAEDVILDLGEAQPFEPNGGPSVSGESKTPKKNSLPQVRMQIQQPYQRSSNSKSSAPKNYYSELFRTPEQSNPASGVVINAGYQSTPGARTGNSIVPVSASSKPKQSPAQSSALPEWARNARSSQQKALPATTKLPQPPASKYPVLPKDGLKIDRTAAAQPTLQLRPPSSASSNVPTVVIENIAKGTQTPSVKIDWIANSEINVGQESECELVVSNVGKSTVYGVTVEANFPPTVRLIDASPKPESAIEKLSWKIGKLEQGQTRRIAVKLIPSRRGPLAATARVHFTGATQAEFVVREPMLALKMEGPSKVMVGEPASQSVTISNPGNGIAKNVRLEALIPVGLEHPRGERLVMDVGSLNPNESRTIRLALVAIGGGVQTVQVSATADGNLLQTSEASVNVIAPSLQAEIDGPSLRYKGRVATYTVKVKNDGTIGTSNVRLKHKIPDGFEFISADKGATYDAPTRILSWFVGRLNANKSAEMKVKLKAVKIGEFVHYIRATSEHGSTTDSQLLTRVEGSASLVIDIADLDDPVEVGTETAYEIRLTNDGSAEAKNVGLSCELPAGVKYVSASGPSRHVVDGNLILFQPLALVKAGETFTFRVHVIGSVEGSLRFRARMTSDASSEPLTFEELTRFYGEN